MVDSNNDDDNGGSVVVSATCKTFHVAVDNNYKATEFKFFSAKRPHMRTFYIALGKNCKVFRLFEPLYHLKITLLPMKPPVTMFVGMWIWTSVAPLQIAIEDTTSITDKQLKTASTCSILGEFFILVCLILLVPYSLTFPLLLLPYTMYT